MNLIEPTVKIIVHENDIPESAITGNVVAIDTEALGLNHRRDRLCLVQLYFSGQDPNVEKEVHCIQLSPTVRAGNAPVLTKLLTDNSIEKIFHFGRFDIGILYHTFDALCSNIYCTRIASRIARTNTESHSLKTLCASLLGINLSKEETGSYWGAATLDSKQLKYAANDVLYLMEIKNKLQLILERENRADIAAKVMAFLPTIVELENRGWSENVFAFQS